VSLIHTCAPQNAKSFQVLASDENARKCSGASTPVCPSNNRQPASPCWQIHIDPFASGRDSLHRAGWISNSNLSKRLDDIIKLLERIEYKFDNYHERIAKLEERTSLLRT